MGKRIYEDGYFVRETRNFQRGLILQVLKDLGTATKAAEFLGMNRANLFRVAKQLGIRIGEITVPMQKRAALLAKRSA
jgi:transcriptional regulator with GAF, ATPase, and Fis domain